MDATLIVSILGSALLLYIIVKLALFFWTYLRPSSLPRYLRPEGAYALITGASDGIGLACAEELLSRGFNVILHGRNRDKLSGIQDRLQPSYPSRDIKLFVCDASDYDISKTVANFVKSISDIPLTILVNNVVGVPTTPAIREFITIEPPDLDATLNISARFQMQITHALLPLLSKNQPALIMNMGSIASLTSAPFICVYGGCKAFNLAFGSSLRLEMQILKKDIEVLGIQIGDVKTPKNSSPAGVLVPSTKRFAKSVFDRVGCGESVVWAWMPHAILAWVVMNLVPEKNLAKVFEERLEAERKGM